MEELVYRTARGMAAEGTPFTGTLFAGLMIKDGKVSICGLVPEEGVM
jgi:phosphoribosylamine--glycine ligase